MIIKKIKRIILILIFLAIVISYTYYKYKNDKNNNYDYTNSIYVITENVTDKATNYYEINDERRLRLTDFFNQDKKEVYIFKNCFISHIDTDVGKTLNDFKEDTCTVTDDMYNTITLDDTSKTILKTIANKLYNEITDVKIIKVNEHYYTTVNFAIRMHNPYKFYYYDLKNNKLNHIYTFQDEDVIGIKEKEKFIFDKEKKND